MSSSVAKSKHTSPTSAELRFVPLPEASLTASLFPRFGEKERAAASGEASIPNRAWPPDTGVVK
jgi:hypothetical protein